MWLAVAGALALVTLPGGLASLLHLHLSQRKLPPVPWTRLAQWLAALGVVVTVIIFGAEEWWPFRAHPSPTPKDPSLSQLILSDRLTLGFVRLGIAALALYLAASVPALAIAGRWMKAFGTGGLSADDAQEAGKTIADLESKLSQVTGQLNQATDQAERLRNERNQLRDLLRRFTRSATR